MSAEFSAEWEAEIRQYVSPGRTVRAVADLLTALDAERERRRRAEQQAETLAEALTFDAVTEQNVARAKRWHPGFPARDSWNGADWSNAMCGEAGEVANTVKKLRRHETGHHGALDGDAATLHEALAAEIADVILYADLLAAKYGIDLPAAVARKFNIVSEREGFPERLRESRADEAWSKTLSGYRAGRDEAKP